MTTGPSLVSCGYNDETACVNKGPSPKCQRMKVPFVGKGTARRKQWETDKTTNTSIKKKVPPNFKRDPMFDQAVTVFLSSCLITLIALDRRQFILHPSKKQVYYAPICTEVLRIGHQLVKRVISKKVLKKVFAQ